MLLRYASQPLEDHPGSAFVQLSEAHLAIYGVRVHATCVCDLYQLPVAASNRRARPVKLRALRAVWRRSHFLRVSAHCRLSMSVLASSVAALKGMLPASVRATIAA